MFWTLVVEGTDGGRGFLHSTLEAAATEAKRLATVNPGKKVYIMEPLISVRTPSQFEWRDKDGRLSSEPEVIPF